jgi:hypothetical protein
MDLQAHPIPNPAPRPDSRTQRSHIPNRQDDATTSGPTGSHSVAEHPAHDVDTADKQHRCPRTPRRTAGSTDPGSVPTQRHADQPPPHHHRCPVPPPAAEYRPDACTDVSPQLRGNPPRHWIQAQAGVRRTSLTHRPRSQAANAPHRTDPNATGQPYKPGRTVSVGSRQRQPARHEMPGSRPAISRRRAPPTHADTCSTSARRSRTRPIGVRYAAGRALRLVGRSSRCVRPLPPACPERLACSLA